MNFRLLHSLAAFVFLRVGALGVEPQPIPVADLDSSFQLIGKLHVALGKYLHVVGVVITESDGRDIKDKLKIQMINGIATQEDIRIAFLPYAGDWGKKGPAGASLNLPEMKVGNTYEMDGYETGGFVGTPDGVAKRTGIIDQEDPYQFATQLVVEKARIVDPPRFGPADFEGKHALLEGVARSRNGQAVMARDDWEVVVDSKAAWPADMEGKSIETYGVYNLHDDPKKFSLVDGQWRLVRLEDQVGRPVELRGEVQGPSGIWYFTYRGISLYVEGMENLPGWNEKLYGRPMVVRGTLEKGMLPRLDQIGPKTTRELKEYYIVRKPSWEPIPFLLGSERVTEGK